MCTITILVSFTLAFAPTASATLVDLELALATDLSGSVSAAEYTLQMQGYIAAFNSTALHNAISSVGGIATTFVFWSGATQQQQAIGWTHLQTPADSMAFATAIAALGRPYSGATAPGSAINFTVPLFDGNGFEGNRLIIDVSGDGEQNNGANTAAARDAAVAAGIIINGLPIGLGAGALPDWYTANVIGGTDSFIQPAVDFGSFSPALLAKLDHEITEVGVHTPEPATLSLVGVALLAIGWKKRGLAKR